MNCKERIIATLSGKYCDQLPFLPRLDNWYLANKLKGTLPRKFQNATLRELTDELDFGYHALNPDWRDYRTPDGGAMSGIGIYDIKLKPYIITLHNVKMKVDYWQGGKTRVEYSTPLGRLTTCAVLSDSMIKSGCTAHVVTEHAVKSANDLNAMAYLLQNAEVTPNYEALRAFKEDFMGGRGITVGLSEIFCSPLHYLQKILMPLDQFYYELCDNPDVITGFEEKVRPFCEKIFDAAANSPADAVLSGSNFDSALTAPDTYRRFMMPYLQSQAEKLHAMGKYLICHTDGENAGLTPLFAKSGFDIADSICPAPMTHLTLKSIRDEFAGKITVWGGVPSVCTLRECMVQRDFEAYVEEMFASIGVGDHLIISIADTLPPDADFDRVLYLAKKVAEFGPVTP